VDRLTHLDLFSGIAGFALAAQWAGFETVGFSEVDPFCCALLRKRFPKIPNYGDITRADFSEFTGRITVLTGGFPCQPWSVTGFRKGEADHRHLWPAMLDVVEVVRPAWVIGENVPNIVSMGQLDRCCNDLEGIGYSVQPFAVPACAIGAPHERERVWIVAHADCQGFSFGESFACNLGEEQPAIDRNAGPEFDANLLRTVHGVPNRVDRIRALGNAIVPQVALPFFQAIAQVESECPMTP
jgi:DNA (cytosine-5)-methyltransferase 1